MLKLRINPLATEDLKEIKEYISSNYIVFYKVDDFFVSIYRILYAERDYLNILFPK